MRIAVIGGGLFGCTAAIHLARAGHEVTLFERSGALMQAASGINQGRLHEGFHYPRSPATVAECKAGLAAFVAEYGRAVVGHAGNQYYAIARTGSRVGAGEYAAFCRRHRLRYRALLDAQVAGWLIDPGAAEAVFQVAEDRLDLCALRSIVVTRLEELGVEVRFEAASIGMREHFDRIVVAAYASTNRVAADLDVPPERLQPLQFEVVEKPVVRMPERLGGVGIVVMDGPFGCIDPWGRSGGRRSGGLHVMGHVVHAIHAANVGLEPQVPAHLAPYLDRGTISAQECARVSRFYRMADATAAFVPALGQAEHVGSMFTVRAVLPGRDHDDARPTMVEQLDEQVIRIFGGKCSCAVDAAHRTADMIREGANQSERAAA